MKNDMSRQGGGPSPGSHVLGNNVPVDSEPGNHQPAVVTGLGAVTAWGAGVDAFWAGLRAGQGAIERPRRFNPDGHRTELASEVPSEALGGDSPDHRRLHAGVGRRRLGAERSEEGFHGAQPT